MRAKVCREFGAPENLRVEDLPAPEPRAGEVLVAVHAIGINFTDLLAIAGRSQLQRHLPYTLGVEAALPLRTMSERKISGRIVLTTRRMPPEELDERIV